ncbi:hypothetical protein KI387_000362, partial [Taxus chinensis]
MGRHCETKTATLKPSFGGRIPLFSRPPVFPLLKKSLYRFRGYRFYNMLDINLFREDKGNDPERVRESQRRRFAKVELVDEVIELDKAWRQRQYELDNLRKEFNKMNKEVAKLKIVSKFQFMI